MHTQAFDCNGNVIQNTHRGLMYAIVTGFVETWFILINTLQFQLQLLIQLVKNTISGSNLRLNCIFTRNQTELNNPFDLKEISLSMKPFFSLVIIIFTSFLFWGCSKTADTVETKDEMVARMLTGGGNKVWRLTGLYLSDIAQTLTDTQTKFTKTYRADPTNADPANPKTGIFTNSDGYIGTWKLISGAAQLYEKFTNNPSGPVAVPYIINSISDTKLDIEYTQNYKSVREVYNGY